MYIASQLVNGYGVDSRVTAILDRAWIDVIPVCNPDGYTYTWTTNRLWRKNRRNNGDGTFGVDLNRNWAFQWGGGGASTITSDETYRGPSAFSEPESAALRDYFIANTTLAGHIDFHSYSQLVLSPWGYTTALAPNNDAFLALGGEMKDAIRRTNGVSYTAGPIASTLYIASGSSVDHAYGAHGVPSYTIEVRDTGSYGFVTPVTEILPNATENFAAAMELADATVDGAVIRFANGAPASVQYDAPAPIVAEVRAIRGSIATNGVTLHWRVGAAGSFTQTTMTAGANGLYGAAFGAVPCGATVQWFVTAQTSVGTGRWPHTPNTFASTQATSTSVTFDDTFETNTGWTVGATGDNATSGLWVRVDPVGTAAQPENDSADAGTLCWVTGQGAIGGAVGAADIDGGTTTLVSPLLDASDPESIVSYRRWYSNNTGSAPNADSMPVQISGDGGVTWVQLEDVTENANAWVEKNFRVADFVPPSAAVRLRFVARDLATGSVVEAGVDAVRVLTSGCPAQGDPADINGDGDLIPNVCEIASGASDCDADGIPDSCEVLAGDVNHDGIPDACQPELEFDGLVTEIVPMTVAGTGVPSGAVCWRVYAKCKSANTTLHAVWGDAADPLSISAAGGFWQSSADGAGDLSVGIPCSNPAATIVYDSYLTIGADCGDGTPIASTGIDFTGFAAGLVGLTNSSTGGAIYVTANGVPAGPDGRILLMQLTTNTGVKPFGQFNLTGEHSRAGGGAEWNAYGLTIPDAALIDCNGNGQHDVLEIASGTVTDCDLNGVPDACQSPAAGADCDQDGLSDFCELVAGAVDANNNGKPDECECVGDTDGNGAVNVEDLIDVIVAWGDAVTGGPDLDGSGLVDADDLVLVLNNWGTCTPPAPPSGS